MKKLVFIIDDDSVYLNFMKGHFNQMPDYQTQIFQSGKDALLALESTQPHVIILDHSFLNDPAKTGIDYLKEIRKKNTQVPVIYITATDSEEVRSKAEKLKVKHYIIKNDSFLIHLRTALDKIANSKPQGILGKLFGK